jgi:predicted nucleic acid-binding Zn ribbon protein
VKDPRDISCFACGETNAPDSRFCKFCGRPLVREEERPTVAQDPRNRFLLWLVLILLVACAVFGIFGLLTSRVFR